MLVFFGGFEMGTLNGEFSSITPVVVAGGSGGALTVGGGGRSGAYHAYSNNYAGQWAMHPYFYFPSALSEFYFQVALMSTRTGNYDGQSYQIIRWRKVGGAILGGIKYNASTNLMEVYTGDFATLVGTFPAPPGNSAYWVFEIHIKIDDSTGIIEIRKDMTPVFSFTGDTKPGADTAVDLFEIGNLQGGYHCVDDFVLNDTTGDSMNSWPGGLRIAALAPTADDGTNEWTPSTGTDHRALVDEVPPSASDFLASPTAGQVERFALADLPAEALLVRAVKIVAQAKKDSGTAPTRIAVGLTLAGGDHYSADKDLPITAGTIVDQTTLNPETGLPYTVAEINAAKLILKSAA